MKNLNAIWIISFSLVCLLCSRQISAKKLNNVVDELVSFDFTESPEEDYLSKPYKELLFTRETDGWIYISVDVDIKKADALWVTLDTDSLEEAVLAVNKQKSTEKSPETMRFVKAGAHNLKLWTRGKLDLKNITVRSIPEIIFFKVVFQHDYYIRIAEKGDSYLNLYGWDYITENNIWDFYNVMVSRGEVAKYAPYISQWREKGGKWINKCGISSVDWEKKMDSPLLDGIIIDEFGAKKTFVERYFAPSIKAIKKLGNNPQSKRKIFYGFCEGGGYNPVYEPLFDAMLEYGYKIAPEHYLAEQRNEKKADDYLEKSLSEAMGEWIEGFPDAKNNLTIFLAPPDTVPRLSWNKFPHINFKVHLDKQFNVIANDPVFENLYGVGFWTALSTSEETMRWYTNLVRHYLIEGNKEMLSEDPYVLTHLKNPGFEDGETAWSFNPAPEGAIDVIGTYKLQFAQSQYGAIPEGARVLYTKRAANNPNVISQEIEDLTPGRLYSLKIYTCDFQNFGDIKKLNISIQLEGCDVLNEKSRDNALLYDKFLTRDGDRVNVCWNSYFRVFRAKGNTGKLILTDWESKEQMGGPAGQEIIWDFIELQPYFGKKLEE